MTVGERIKKRRKEIGLTVDELAQRLNKNRATIYRYENDEIENLSITILEPLAKALLTTPAELMGWDMPHTSSVNPQTVKGQMLLSKYNRLNDFGKDKVLERVDELIQLPQYTQDVKILAARAKSKQTKDGIQHDLDLMMDDDF